MPKKPAYNGERSNPITSELRAILFGEENSNHRVNGRTTQSSQADGAEATLRWIWLVVGGVVAISPALTITMLALRRRKK